MATRSQSQDSGPAGRPWWRSNLLRLALWWVGLVVLVTVVWLVVASSDPDARYELTLLAYLVISIVLVGFAALPMLPCGVLYLAVLRWLGRDGEVGRGLALGLSPIIVAFHLFLAVGPIDLVTALLIVLGLTFGALVRLPGSR